MADEKKGWSKREPFHIGRGYEEVGPELGCLHDARHAETGAPALVFIPGERMEWHPEGPWQVRLSYQPEPATVMLRVEQAPRPLRVTDMANLFVLTTAALQRVEDNPRVHALLERMSLSAGRDWMLRARDLWRSHAGKVLAGCAALALLQGSCIHGGRFAPSVMVGQPAQVDGQELISAEDPTRVGKGYPLPSEPFRNQSAGPCNAKRGEVEINGGCWVALEQRPPCLEVQAEYQGKCYLPVAKPERPAQSAQP